MNPVGSDFDDVHGLPVARYGHVVRTAKALDIKCNANEPQLTNGNCRICSFSTLDGVQRDTVLSVSKSNVLPSDMPRKMDWKTA